MSTYERTCPVCGTDFTSKAYNAVYCPHCCRKLDAFGRCKCGGRR